MASNQGLGTVAEEKACSSFNQRSRVVRFRHIAVIFFKASWLLFAGCLADNETMLEDRSGMERQALMGWAKQRYANRRSIEFDWEDPTCSWPGVECTDGFVSGLELEAQSLTGTLPVDLSQLESLRKLMLIGNHLSGTLPAEWSRMQSLEQLDLRGNQLSGTLPSQWSGMTNLVELRVFGYDVDDLIRPPNCADLDFQTLVDFQPLLRVLDSAWVCLPAVVDPWWPFIVCLAAIAVVCFFAAGAWRLQTIHPGQHLLRLARLQAPDLALLAMVLVLCGYNAAFATGLGQKIIVDMAKTWTTPTQVVSVVMANTIAITLWFGIWWLHKCITNHFVERIVLEKKRVLRRGCSQENFSKSVKRQGGQLLNAMNWTPAASRDVFQECARLMQFEQARLLGLFGVLALLVSSVVSQLHVSENESPGIEALATMISFIDVICLYFLLVTVVRPVEMSNMAVSRAVANMKSPWLARTRHAPRAMLLTSVTSILSVGILLGVHSWFKSTGKHGFYDGPGFSTGSKIGLGWLILGMAIPLAMALLLVLLMIGPLHVWHSLHMWAASHHWRSWKISMALTGLQSYFGVRPGDRKNTATCQARCRWWMRRMNFELLSVNEGCVFRSRRLLYVAILCVQGLPQVTKPVVVATWAVTFGFLIALLLIHDRQAADGQEGFRDLLKGPGFGLVVDARDLQAALEATLCNTGQKQNDAEAAEQNVYHGTIRRYKANFFRMQRTMAISYRWQAQDMAIACPAKGISEDTDGSVIGINMSRWQLEQILLELKSSWVDYVWLDKLSVNQNPQDPEFAKLQRTLLARMMAVYVAVDHSLVLRSLEDEMGRYHQRAWTCQEYCCSRHLVVRTEPSGNCDGEAIDDGSDSCSGKAASSHTEAHRMKILRKSVQQDMVPCCPLWIALDHRDSKNDESSHHQLVDACFFRPGSEDALLRKALPDIVSCVKLYERLARKVYCWDNADRVRSLVPMLFNCPVEGHVELMKLLEYVQLRWLEKIRQLNPAIAQALKLLRDAHVPEEAVLISAMPSITEEMSSTVSDNEMPENVDSAYDLCIALGIDPSAPSSESIAPASRLHSQDDSQGTTRRGLTRDSAADFIMAIDIMPRNNDTGELDSTAAGLTAGNLMTSSEE